MTLPPDPRSSADLLRATLAAAAAAAVILVTIVLPAEYGLDPTGAGRALGVFRPADASAAESARAEADSSGAVTVTGQPLLRRDTPFRTEEMTLTLRSGEGAEIKADMRRGERIVFSWTTTGGGVDVDMHGEARASEGGAVTSYYKGEFETSGHGAFEAPVTGYHGWFWQNLNDDPVTVTVRVSGYFFRLFRP
ncbi:MAG: hypothetical protein AB1635_05275 [Acidobacteriota bacterium]